MHRIEVIQKTIDKMRAKTYLEIGVEYGTVFLRVKARRKFAIDPNFKIPFYKKYIFLNNIWKSKFFKITSDIFFSKYAFLFTMQKIDVAFIDGLHTYEQSLRDAENCLRYLSKKGVIIMHDCYPQNAASSSPSLEEAKKMSDWNKTWCGDTWKTIVHLRSTRSDLQVFVLDCDYGLGIIAKGKPDNLLEYSKSEINKMTYSDFLSNKNNLLNLKDPVYLEKFLNIIDLS